MPAWDRRHPLTVLLFHPYHNLMLIVIPTTISNYMITVSRPVLVQILRLHYSERLRRVHQTPHSLEDRLGIEDADPVVLRLKHPARTQEAARMHRLIHTNKTYLLAFFCKLVRRNGHTSPAFYHVL